MLYLIVYNNFVMINHYDLFECKVNQNFNSVKRKACISNQPMTPVFIHMTFIHMTCDWYQKKEIVIYHNKLHRIFKTHFLFLVILNI